MGLANLSAQKISSSLIAPTLTFNIAVHPPYKDPSCAYSCSKESWELSFGHQLS